MCREKKKLPKRRIGKGLKVKTGKGKKRERGKYVSHNGLIPAILDFVKLHVDWHHTASVQQFYTNRTRGGGGVEDFPSK